MFFFFFYQPKNILARDSTGRLLPSMFMSQQALSLIHSTALPEGTMLSTPREVLSGFTSFYSSPYASKYWLRIFSVSLVSQILLSTIVLCRSGKVDPIHFFLVFFIYFFNKNLKVPSSEISSRWIVFLLVHRISHVALE